VTYKNYTCNVTVQYYDAPTVPWNISVQISDQSGTNFGPVNSTSTFSYAPTYAFSMSPSYVNWSTPAITPTTTAREADNVLSITNCGNTNITNGTAHYLRINATKLTGVPYADTIGASNFTARGAQGAGTYCAVATNFTDGNFYDITFFSVSKGPASIQPLGFCLRQIPPLTGVPENFTSLINWDVNNV